MRAFAEKERVFNYSNSDSKWFLVQWNENNQTNLGIFKGGSVSDILQRIDREIQLIEWKFSKDEILQMYMDVFFEIMELNHIDN